MTTSAPGMSVNDAVFGDALAGADGTAAPVQRLQLPDFYPDPLADPTARSTGMSVRVANVAAASVAAPPVTAGQADWRSIAEPARAGRPRQTAQAQYPAQPRPTQPRPTQPRPVQPRPAVSRPAPALARRPGPDSKRASMVPAEFAVRAPTAAGGGQFGGFHPLSTVAAPYSGYPGGPGFQPPPVAVQRALSATQHLAAPYTGPRAADLLSRPRQPPKRPAAPVGTAARASAASAARSKPGRSSGIWGTVVFLAIMLFASGGGRQLLDWITQLFK